MLTLPDGPLADPNLWLVGMVVWAILAVVWIRHLSRRSRRPRIGRRSRLILLPLAALLLASCTQPGEDDSWVLDGPDAAQGSTGGF